MKLLTPLHVLTVTRVDHNNLPIICMLRTAVCP